MHLARLCGIEAPVSGLVRSADGTWSYFVRRFDRVGHGRKVRLEDFAQLVGLSRDMKHGFNLELLVRVEKIIGRILEDLAQAGPAWRACIAEFVLPFG